MDKSDARRKRILKLVAVLLSDEGAGIMPNLFDPLKVELTDLVSEEGFLILLERSVFVTSRKYPWLGARQSSANMSTLSNVKAMLEQRDLTEANEAGTELLLNFIDLLASLIGEPLLIDILCSAWGKDAFGSLAGGFQE